jgi:hypothetical protein
MSDFSSLCPLFNSGVYSEITLPYFSLTSRSTTNKFEGGLPFSRSVIVTHAYVKKHTTFTATATAVKLAICRAASWAATRTVFATINLSATITTQAIGKYLPFTVTAKTFSSTQVLNLKALKKEAGAKNVSVIVRYKEK